MITDIIIIIIIIIIMNWTLFIIDFSLFYHFFINFDSTFFIKKIIIIN